MVAAGLLLPGEPNWMRRVGFVSRPHTQVQRIDTPLPLPFFVIFLVFIGLGAVIWAKFLILLLPPHNFFD